MNFSSSWRQRKCTLDLKVKVADDWVQDLWCLQINSRLESIKFCIYSDAEFYVIESAVMGNIFFFVNSIFFHHLWFRIDVNVFMGNKPIKWSPNIKGLIKKLSPKLWSPGTWHNTSFPFLTDYFSSKASIQYNHAAFCQYGKYWKISCTLNIKTVVGSTILFL